MTPALKSSICAALLLATGLAAAATPAQAGDVTCNVPRKERQPATRLQSQLHHAGWWIRKMEVEHGCYEVYGEDENHKPVRALFDPRTLDRAATVQATPARTAPSARFDP